MWWHFSKYNKVGVHLRKSHSFPWNHASATHVLCAIVGAEAFGFTDRENVNINKGGEFLSEDLEGEVQEKGEEWWSMDDSLLNTYIKFKKIFYVDKKKKEYFIFSWTSVWTGVLHGEKM